MDDNRSPIHAYVSAEAADGWRAFAEANGLSVSGLVEAFGLELPADEPAPDEAVDLDAVVRRARRTDAMRRRRQRRSD